MTIPYHPNDPMFDFLKSMLPIMKELDKKERQRRAHEKAQLKALLGIHAELKKLNKALSRRR